MASDLTIAINAFSSGDPTILKGPRSHVLQIPKKLALASNSLMASSIFFQSADQNVTRAVYKPHRFVTRVLSI